MRRKDNNGFTLIEVMVALAVMGILLVGLLETLNYHLDVASQHEARTITTQLASQKLTEAREDHTAAEGDFDKPYQDYHYKTELGETKYPGVGFIDVTVIGHGEKAVLRELFRLKQDSLTGDNTGTSSQEMDNALNETTSGNDSGSSSGSTTGKTGSKAAK